MKSRSRFTRSLMSALAMLVCNSFMPALWATSASTEFVGWSTNGPAVYRLRFVGTQVMPGLPVSLSPPPADLPPEVRRAMLVFRAASNVTTITNTKPVFDHFVAGSLNNTVWTNFIAHTNGRSMQIWSERSQPFGWPLRDPVVKWNPKSLIWGMRGMTALSPSWQYEGPIGFMPITALTRRHGYTRGHAMGPDRVGNSYAGRKVWFVTRNNQIVQRTILHEIVRTVETSGRDYTLMLFSSDLPEAIEPMRVARPEDGIYSSGPSRYPFCLHAPNVVFETEQGGNVSAEVPGFQVDTMKGGDSGSPNMLPLPGELVFWSGRTSSGASPQMQVDMDTLCRLERLDPAKYQLQWVDLSAYPKY
ncbi:MAG TPA: hypothetical protein VKY92_10425 [Verrucomicrobiae bacterium]|nr:hypothetical protein [Verrucomicrobiae bacterium]